MKRGAGSVKFRNGSAAPQILSDTMYLSIFESHLPHQSVNLLFKLVAVNNKLTVWGGVDFSKLINNTFYEIKPSTLNSAAWHHGRRDPFVPGAECWGGFDASALLGLASRLLRAHIPTRKPPPPPTFRRCCVSVYVPRFMPS